MIQAKEDENIEFKWGKKKGVGGKKKDVQFYESFTFDGVEYVLYDSVYAYTDSETEPYIGKIIKAWENPDKTKRVKILWFFRPLEITNYLGAIKPSENELFLASGVGEGLANVNPLEVIAGKCNVICTSKDSRNPQPSDEELQMADFIFCRTFDVGRRVILDKIDDKIALVDVKFLLNKVNSLKSIAVTECGSIKKEIFGNAIVADGTVLCSDMNALVERKNLKIDDSSIHPLPKENADSNISLANQRSSVRQTPASYAREELNEMAKIDYTRGNLSSDKSISKFKVKDNANLITVGAKLKSSLGEKPTSDVLAKLGDEAKISDPQKYTASDKSSSRTKYKEIADPKPSLVKQKSSVGEKRASNVGIELGGIDKNKKQESMSNDKITSRSVDDRVMGDTKAGKVPAIEFRGEEKIKATEGSSRVANRPSNNDNLDSVRTSDCNKEKTVHKLICDSKCCDAKDVDRTVGEKSKRKLEKDPNETEILSCKKKKLDEKLSKFAKGKLPRESPREASMDVGNTGGSNILQVTRRPEADKSKWFKGLPWEERMKAAHAEGKLILLQNLDPSYTRSEVEDIVLHALKQKCTANMIPRAALSSPYSGKAFAIFKTREAAETAVAKLDEGCLMMPNGRPLVGSIAKLSFLGKPSTFFGHMSIDKTRHQMQREMREAVSTSHCSQPNTIEYDMALEWCLLQEQTNLEWERLYKQHGKELRKLEATMRSR